MKLLEVKPDRFVDKGVFRCGLFGLSVCCHDAIYHHVVMMERGR